MSSGDVLQGIAIPITEYETPPTYAQCEKVRGGLHRPPKCNGLWSLQINDGGMSRKLCNHCTTVSLSHGEKWYIEKFNVDVNILAVYFKAAVFT